MKSLRLEIFTTFVVLAIVTGCSDPSDNVHKSSASEPIKNSESAPQGANEYVIRSGSKVDFVGSKVTGSHSGGFTNVAGTIKVADGKVIGTSDIKINLKTTWSDNDRLTGHLKSPDFFDSEKYPTATFTVTKIEPEGGKYKVTANLDLHGVTKSISFPADVEVSDKAVKVKADFAINRKDFNINYPGKPNDLIRDNVVIKLDVLATPGPATPADQISG